MGKPMAAKLTSIPFGEENALTLGRSKRDKGDDNAREPEPHRAQSRSRRTVIPNFYATFLGLNSRQQADLEYLTRDDWGWKQTVVHCAMDWQEQRSRGISELELRRMYLDRAALAAKQFTHTAGDALVAAAFALALCEEVEELVADLDLADEGDENP